MTTYRQLPKLDADAVAHYLEKPYGCPYCQGGDLDGSGVEIEESWAYWFLDCRTCGRHWRNCYRLTSVLEDLIEELPPALEPLGAWDGS